MTMQVDDIQSSNGGVPDFSKGYKASGMFAIRAQKLSDSRYLSNTSADIQNWTIMSERNTGTSAFDASTGIYTIPTGHGGIWAMNGCIAVNAVGLTITGQQIRTTFDIDGTEEIWQAISNKGKKDIYIPIMGIFDITAGSAVRMKGASSDGFTGTINAGNTTFFSMFKLF